MLGSIAFSENCAVYEVMCTKFCRVGQATNNNMAQQVLHTGYMSLQTQT
jgi:hypothetical protein